MTKNTFVLLACCALSAAAASFSLNSNSSVRAPSVAWDQPPCQVPVPGGGTVEKAVDRDMPILA